MTLYGPAEPTLIRPRPAAQHHYGPTDATFVRPRPAAQQLYGPPEPFAPSELAPQPYGPGEIAVHEDQAPRQERQSTARIVGRIFDWMAISLLSLSVCALICQQGFGVFSPG